MRVQVRQQREELHRLKLVMHVLEKGSDKEASEVLARLRLGESVEQLARILEGRYPSESVFTG